MTLNKGASFYIFIKKNAIMEIMPMFKKIGSTLVQVKEIPFKLEKDLQEITEQNLKIIFGLEFVKAQHGVEGLSIDTLAFDPESKAFIIIEYKRDASSSIVDQGLSYLSLMQKNKSDFVLAYNELLNKNMKREEVDWSQSRIIFIARSFTTHQQNAVNFKNLPFELWEVVQFENELVQYKHIETSKNAESFEVIKNIAIDAKKAVRQVKEYTEADVFGQKGESYDLYMSIKEQITKIYPDLVLNPKKIYIGYQLANNWRNIFNIQKIRAGIRIDIMRSKPSDFDDPQKKVGAVDKSREYWGQDISKIEIRNMSDIRYSMIIIQQAYDRFVKEFGN